MPTCSSSNRLPEALQIPLPSSPLFPDQAHDLIEQIHHQSVNLRIPCSRTGSPASAKRCSKLFSFCWILLCAINSYNPCAYSFVVLYFPYNGASPKTSRSAAHSAAPAQPLRSAYFPSDTQTASPIFSAHGYPTPVHKPPADPFPPAQNPPDRCADSGKQIHSYSSLPVPAVRFYILNKRIQGDAPCLIQIDRNAECRKLLLDAACI